MRSTDDGKRDTPLQERPLDLKIWLAKHRDKRTWRQIGDEHFPNLKLEARRSEARRAEARVEQLLDDQDSPASRAHHLKARIEETFGVPVEDFRAFIRTGKLPLKRAKPR